ncbi:MAG: AmmeMemoRadiSam system radical SAM enzyme [Candidatus Orphnella occulta]|nr:AmmeMemoRadiSam system radical SAM enzyme [Candidatus Orphnella occulta]
MLHKAEFYKSIGHKSVKCFLCGHNCVISLGQFGFCNLRKNIDGHLQTYTYAEVIASNVDPIEKKPLYHFLPGSNAFSIATPGCNFRCDFCQNWQISQVDTLKDTPIKSVTPDKIVNQALDAGCQSIAYTYTEPTIFFEYAYDTARIAKENGLYNLFVTNGYMSREAIDKIYPYLDGANIDLKSFSDDFYKKRCKARLEPVLDAIRYMKKLGIWVEVTTLVIPGLNDSDQELRKIADFIATVGCEIPWHISRFHPDYMHTDSKPTPIETLHRTANIGRDAGLCYIYVGNISQESPTLCCQCGHLLIKREYPAVKMSGLNGKKCEKCDTPLDGVF